MGLNSADTESEDPPTTISSLSEDAGDLGTKPSGSSSFDFRVAGFARIKAIRNRTEVLRLRLQFITLIPNLGEALVRNLQFVKRCGSAFFRLTGFVLIVHARFEVHVLATFCLLYTSPSPRDATLSRMPSSA